MYFFALDLLSNFIFAERFTNSRKFTQRFVNVTFLSMISPVSGSKLNSPFARCFAKMCLRSSRSCRLVSISWARIESMSFNIRTQTLLSSASSFILRSNGLVLTTVRITSLPVSTPALTTRNTHFNNLGGKNFVLRQNKKSAEVI